MSQKLKIKTRVIGRYCVCSAVGCIDIPRIQLGISRRDEL